MHTRSLMFSLAMMIGCGAGEPPPQAVARDTSAPRPVLVLATGPAPRMEAHRIFESTCMGEDCRIQFPAQACVPVALRASETDTARVVAQVARGDKVEITTRNLHVVEPGKVLIRRALTLDTDDMSDERTPRKDTLHFAVGDTLYPLAYVELGQWIWRYRGVEGTGGAFWADPFAREEKDDGTSAAILLSRPRHEDWWRIKLPNGTAGWWRADNLMALQMTAEEGDEGETEPCPRTRAPQPRG